MGNCLILTPGIVGHRCAKPDTNKLVYSMPANTTWTATQDCIAIVTTSSAGSNSGGGRVFVNDNLEVSTRNNDSFKTTSCQVILWKDDIIRLANSINGYGSTTAEIYDLIYK